MADDGIQARPTVSNADEAIPRFPPMAANRVKEYAIQVRPTGSKADGAIPPMEAPSAVAVAASVDTAKSQIHPTVTTSKQLKEEEKKEEGAKKEKKDKKEEEAKKEKKDKKEEEAKKEKKENGVHKLKSNLLVTGVVVAVIGAIFAIVKNIKKA